MLVEHDMGFVMEQCDTVAVLELGRVLATGDTPGDPGEPAGARRVPRRGLQEQAITGTSNTQGGQS